MKKIAVFITLLSLILPSFANPIFVKGYFKDDGTFVAPYLRTSPDDKKYNNFSYTGYFKNAGARKKRKKSPKRIKIKSETTSEKKVIAK